MKTLPHFFSGLLLLLALFFSPLAFAQTANLQIIHNALGAASSEGPAVDIYLNGQTTPELQGLPFRAATAFLEVDAGIPVVAGLALSPSESAADTLLAIDLGAFEPGSNIVAMVYGAVGDAASPLRVALQEAAPAISNRVSLLPFHGSVAPTAIDITDFFQGFSITGIKYGDFGESRTIIPGEYFLEVAASGTADLLGTFQFDLSSRGGQSLVLFSSGSLDAEPLFNLFVVAPDGQVEPFLPVALVQIIHNSPAPSLTLTDVWLGNLGILLLDDFAYLEATPVAFFPTRLVVDLGFAPPGSSNVSEVEYLIEGVSFADGRQYTVFVGGLPDDAAFPLQLFINDQARLLAPDPGQVAVSVFQGIPDLETADVDLRDSATLVMDLGYGQFSPYLDVAAGAAVWILSDAAEGKPLASFAGDLTLAAGYALPLFTGGFTADDPLFGMYAALPDGQVVPLDPVTRVQLIHNAPAEAYDVYINGERILNDLVFRGASPFIDLPTRTGQEVALVPWSAPPGSEPVVTFDPLTFGDGRDYLLMLAGVSGSVDQPLRLERFDEAQLSVESDQQTGLLFFHGSPDAPALDLFTDGMSPLFAGVARGSFAGYEALPASTTKLMVSPAGDDQSVLGAYDLDLRELAGKTAVLFATGYLEPGQIAPFDVWIALADGTTRSLSRPSAARQAENFAGKLSLWPNPAPNGANLEFQLTRSSGLEIAIVDGQGRGLRRYNLGQLAAGSHRFRLDTGGLPAGVLLVVIRAGGEVLSTRLFVP